MKDNFLPQRDFAGLEARRIKAGMLFAKSKTRAEVARSLEVSWPAVNAWYRTWRSKGKAGLKAAGRAGRKPRLSASQLARVEQGLLSGPKSQGYTTRAWSLPRIARLIYKITGVQYHSGHVWRILHGLGWSVRRPGSWTKSE
jgi:transposase